MTSFCMKNKGLKLKVPFLSAEIELLKFKDEEYRHVEFVERKNEKLQAQINNLNATNLNLTDCQNC